MSEKLKERMDRRKENRERELKRLEKRARRLDEEETRDNEELRKLKVVEANNEKFKSQKLFIEDKKERQRLQDLKVEAKSEKTQMRDAYEHGRQLIERDRAMGLSQKEIKDKYLDKNTRIRQMNKQSEKESETLLPRLRQKFKSHLDTMY